MSNLSVVLRPKSLAEVIGHTNVRKALQRDIDEDRVARAYMFSGPPGLGKTTLAMILARAIQGKDYPTDSPIDLIEVNAAENNKVEFIRNLVSETAYLPFSGRYKVVLLNEAQQLTGAAQEVLQPPLEDKDSSTVWILTTKEPDKIDSAIQDRCKHFKLKPLSAEVEISELIEKAAQHLGGEYPSEQTSSFITQAVNGKIGSPRILLQAYEQLMSGIPLKDCFTSSVHEPLYKDVAIAVVKGDWNTCRTLLLQIPVADSKAMRNIVSGFLRSAILKNESGAKAAALASCLVGMGSAGFEDGLAYSSVVGLFYKTCSAISGVK